MNYKEILEGLNEEKSLNEENKEINPNSRVLIIDGLNMFFRNFAILNMVNSEGEHIGGLGGFLRSLGSMINMIKPTSVYVIFDGPGSSQNRKNIIPEYKSSRNQVKITNWDIFENIEDENDSKIDQIVRLIQYLKMLPVKILSLPKVEADDVIAILSEKLSEDPENQIFMITNDRDYLQLLKKNVILYLPSKKDYYSRESIVEEYKVLPENFILYKTLLGDASDNVSGVKGLGPKKILSLFPELQNRVISLEELFEISADRMKDNVIYARVVQAQDSLRNSHKIMDLSEPMVGEDGYRIINELMESQPHQLNKDMFKRMYSEDELGKIVRNVDKWFVDCFENLNKIRILEE